MDPEKEKNRKKEHRREREGGGDSGALSQQMVNTVGRLQNSKPKPSLPQATASSNQGTDGEVRQY